MAEANAKPKVNIAKVIEVYIKLRDRREARKRDFDEADAGDAASQASLEALMMAHFNETGQDSASVTGLGTAYRSVTESVTVADRDAFFGFCLDRELPSLMDIRASKNACVEYRNAKGHLPPGLNNSRAFKINFRRG